MSSGPVEPPSGGPPFADEPAHAPDWLNIGPTPPYAPAPADAPAPSHYVDPSWPSPVSTRRWRTWGPGVAIALVCALCFAAAAFSARDQHPAFDRFLPPEDTTAAVSTSAGQPAQLEQTVLVKAQVNSLGHLGGVIEALRPADDLPKVTWLRATVTPAGGSTGVIVFSVVGGALSFEGLALAGQAAALSPGIVLARADQAAPAAQQQGQAISPKGAATPYVATVSAAPTTDPDCSTSVLSITPLPEPMKSMQTEITLCKQRGLQAMSVTSGVGTYAFGQSGPVPNTRFDGRLTPDAAPTDRQPQTWRQATQIFFQEGAFGIEKLSLSPFGDPAVRPGGGLVVVNHDDEDVLALGPGITGLDAVPLQWRVHPGGAVLSLATLGELTLASTTQRSLVAYGPDGRRYWSRSFPDVVAGEIAVDAGTESVVVATLDGQVTALDARTGGERWTYSLGANLAVSPLVNGGGVTVADADGGIAHLDLRTGRLRWAQSSDTAAVHLAANDTGVFVFRTDVTAFEADTGRQLWNRLVSGNRRNGFAAGTDLVVAATQAGVVAFDARTGAPRWSAAGSEILVPVGSDFVVGTGKQVELLQAGKVLRQWTLSRDAASYGSCSCALTPTGIAFPGYNGVEVLQ